MLRLSKLTDYGIVVMTCLAEEPEAIRAANEVSACTGVALPTVSKVLKLLSRALLVVSCRGAKGGYRLARAAAAKTGPGLRPSSDGLITALNWLRLDSCCIESSGKPSW